MFDARSRPHRPPRLGGQQGQHRLERAESERRHGKAADGPHAREQQHGQGRHHQQRVVVRVQSGQRSSEDHPRGADQRCHHHGQRGQCVGREAHQHGAALVLGGRAGRHPPAGETEIDPYQSREEQHHAGHHQLAHRKPGTQNRNAFRRHQRFDVDVVGSEPNHDQRLHREHQCDRHHHLGQGRRGTYRPEHQPVNRKPQQQGHREAKHQRDRDTGLVGERDAADREHQSPVLAKPGKDIGAPHRDGALRKVDDAGCPVNQQQRVAQPDVDRAKAEPQHDELQIDCHAGVARPSRSYLLNADVSSST